jgi:hypothetical protein
MQCKCGGEVIESSHEVKRMTTALLWAERVISKPDPIKLPVIVEKHVCTGCGRSFHLIENKLNKESSMDFTLPITPWSEV